MKYETPEKLRVRQYVLASAEMRRLAQQATLNCVEAPTAINHMHATLGHKRAAFCFRQLDPGYRVRPTPFEAVRTAAEFEQEHHAQAAIHAAAYREAQAK